MPRTKKHEIARVQWHALTSEEAEELFKTVDETGHTNEETAARQRRHRSATGTGVDIDPLANEDPSGSNIGKTIAKAATAFVVIMFVVIVGSQLFFGYERRMNTANLSENVSVRNVASALAGGVEWGNGFTQFPEQFSVQEADQNTGRIEVTVTDTTSETALEVIAGANVQASALAVNSLLNPNINTVIYHVNVHEDESGKIQTSSFFGFFKPKGGEKSLITFIWTKSVSATGEVHFNCQISGLDDNLQGVLRNQITSRFTPSNILGLNNDSNTSVVVQNEEAAAKENKSAEQDKTSNKDKDKASTTDKNDANAKSSTSTDADATTNKSAAPAPAENSASK